MLRKLRCKPATPLADGLRLYVCGDIHGRLDLLDRLLDRIDAHYASHPIDQAVPIFLGDYVDRGPDSASVIERLVEVSGSYGAICLRGNHEAMMSRFLAYPGALPAWAELGALPTLMSYGLTPPLKPSPSDCIRLSLELASALPDSHHRFLAALPTSYSCGQYHFVHAGIRPGIALDDQVDDDLMWIREDFLDCEDQYEKTIVHGHTPVLVADVRANRINIDTGAYATGQLTCLVLQGQDMAFL